MGVIHSIFLTLIFLMALFCVRIEVAFRLRMNALAIIHAMGMQQIEAGIFDKWEALYADYEAAHTYNALILNLRIWTTRQAYPQLFPKARP